MPDRSSALQSDTPVMLPPTAMVSEHPWPRSLRRSAVDHVVVALSDVEMGAGGSTDDFPQSDFLGGLIEAYNRPPFHDVPVTVVFNGDTFDLLKTSYLERYPVRVTADVAVGKLTRVAAAHPLFFEHLRRFLRHADADRQLVFLTGNHDLELAFPEVQRLIRDLCGGDRRVFFPGQSHRVGDARFEHGHRADPLFAVEDGKPFVGRDEERLLNLPWGAVALLEVAMPMHPVLHALDRIRPRERVLEALPEVRDLLLLTYWRYWTHDYWRDYFAEGDPLKKVSWSMLKEIIYRFGTHHADVSMGDHYQRQLAGRDADTRLYVVGHQHEAGWWSQDGRKVLRTGCFRNEFILAEDGSYEPIGRVYAEIFQRDGRTQRSHLVEVDAPPPPPPYMPTTIEELRPDVRRMLDQRRQSDEEDAPWLAQEEKEARDGGASALVESSGFPFLRTLRQALSAGDDDPG